MSRQSTDLHPFPPGSRLPSLQATIEKALSYDAGPLVTEQTCPHCGKVTQPAIMDYWLDHKSELLAAIVRRLCLGARSAAIVDDMIEDMPVTGDRETDADNLTKRLLSEFPVP